MDLATTSSQPIVLGHALSSLCPAQHNGPGRRIALWTQGCVHRCTENCLNPHFLDPTRGLRFTVSAVHQAVLKAARDSAAAVEGVTVLGGEPFEQADAVADLLERLRRDGLSTMVYSGHTWESLKRLPQPGIARLLATVDLLVDGPFLPEFYEETLAWRGSSNQRLLCLTDRYEERTLAEAYSRQKKGFSIQIGDGSISLSGLQSEGTARAAEAWLAGASLPPENLDAEVGAQTF